MGFCRQEHWSELPCPLPGDLPDPGIKPESLASPALVDGFFTTSATCEVHTNDYSSFNCSGPKDYLDILQWVNE